MTTKQGVSNRLMIVISDVYNKYIISEKYTKIQAIKFSMFQNEGVLSLS